MFNKIEIIQKILQKKRVGMKWPKVPPQGPWAVGLHGDWETQEASSLPFSVWSCPGRSQPTRKDESKNLLMWSQRVAGRKRGMLALVDGEESEEEILCLRPPETVDLTMEEDRESRVA